MKDALATTAQQLDQVIISQLNCKGIIRLGHWSREMGGSSSVPLKDVRRDPPSRRFSKTFVIVWQNVVCSLEFCKQAGFPNSSSALCEESITVQLEVSSATGTVSFLFFCSLVYCIVGNLCLSQSGDATLARSFSDIDHTKESGRTEQDWS